MKLARLYPTAYQNLWHAFFSIFFSVTKDEMFAFPSRNAYFPTPSPLFNVEDNTKRFFQNGKISGAFKIDSYMVRRSKV